MIFLFFTENIFLFTSQYFIILFNILTLLWFPRLLLDTTFKPKVQQRTAFWKWKISYPRFLCVRMLILNRKYTYNDDVRKFDENVDIFYDIWQHWQSTVPKVISCTKFYRFLGRSGTYQYLLGYDRYYVFEQVCIWRHMVDPSWRFHYILSSGLQSFQMVVALQMIIYKLKFKCTYFLLFLFLQNKVCLRVP